MSGTAKTVRAKGLTPEEKTRRNAALEQAWRIKAYLKTLRAREQWLAAESRELHELISDELKAFDDLVWESSVDIEQVQRRDRERTEERQPSAA